MSKIVQAAVITALTMALFQNCSKNRSGDISLSSASSGSQVKFLGACSAHAGGFICGERWDIPEAVTGMKSSCVADGAAWMENCPLTPGLIGSCLVKSSKTEKAARVFYYRGYHAGATPEQEKGLIVSDCRYNGYEWQDAN